jgi:hypothetical protein
MAARNRIIYASQSVWCNGEVLYRVQSLGSSSTLNSEDVNELGHLDVIDVVDDVPEVAVTLNTNDFGDVRTLATLAQVAPAKRAMDETATDTNANLRVVDSSESATGDYLHGVSIADFAVVCGNLPGVTFWAPVQDECSMGTLDNNIDQTLFMDKVFINSLEFTYDSGANATENYEGETDNKTWFLNDGRFITMDSYTVSGTDVSNGYIDLSLPTDGTIATLSDGNMAFLRRTTDGINGITLIDVSEESASNIAIESGSVAQENVFVYEDTGTEHRVHFPTVSNVPAEGDIIEVIYAADMYGTSASGRYFRSLSDTNRPDTLGAVRQGQIEVFIVADDDTAFNNAWRLTSCSVSADLTRESLNELGHLAPYDRPLTLPIPLTISVDSTMGDLENWAIFANKKDAFDSGELDDISLKDLMAEEDLKLVVKIYAQTDEEAGGNNVNRTIRTNSDLIGYSYFDNGTKGTYAAAGDQEFALKTVIVENLKITSEGNTLDLGENMTQTFEFRANNALYIVKGDVDIDMITSGNKIRRNG